MDYVYIYLFIVYIACMYVSLRTSSVINTPMQSNWAQTDRRPFLPLTLHPARLLFLHCVVRGAVPTHNWQMIVAWRRKGAHKVSPLMVGVVRMMGLMMRGRCHSCRGSLLVLLMAAIGLEFRAWYAQLFDLGQIGLHVAVHRSCVCPPVDLLSCFNESPDLQLFL